MNLPVECSLSSSDYGWVELVAVHLLQ